MRMMAFGMFRSERPKLHKPLCLDELANQSAEQARRGSRRHASHSAISWNSDNGAADGTDHAPQESHQECAFERKIGKTVAG